MKYLYIENALITNSLIEESVPIYSIPKDNIVLVSEDFPNKEVGSLVRIVNGDHRDGVYLVSFKDKVVVDLEDGEEFIYALTLHGNNTIKADENKEANYLGSLVAVHDVKVPKDHVRVPQLAVKYHHLEGVQEFPQENDPRFNLVQEREAGDIYYSSLDIDIPKNELKVLKNFNHIFETGMDACVLSVYDSGYVSYHIKIKEVMEAPNHYTYVCMLLEPEVHLSVSLDPRD